MSEFNPFENALQEIPIKPGEEGLIASLDKLFDNLVETTTAARDHVKDRGAKDKAHMMFILLSTLMEQAERNYTHLLSAVREVAVDEQMTILEKELNSGNG